MVFSKLSSELNEVGRALMGVGFAQGRTLKRGSITRSNASVANT
jgi:hypothetical protein